MDDYTPSFISFEASIAELENSMNVDKPFDPPQIPALSAPELTDTEPNESHQNKPDLLSVSGIAKIPKWFWRDYLGFGVDKHR